jgi:hypothetical protein
MQPVVDTIHELDQYLQPYPITQVEVEVVDEKGNPLRHLLDVLRLNRAAQDKLWEALADARFYGREQILPKELAETLWRQLMGGDYRAEEKFVDTCAAACLLRRMEQERIRRCPLENKRYGTPKVEVSTQSPTAGETASSAYQDGKA